MSFHLAAYSASVANTGNVDMAAIADQMLTIQNGHFLPQEDMNLLFAYAGSLTMQRTRIVSPTNRQITLPFIRPFNLALLPTNNPNVAWYAENPFRVKGLEELAVEVSQGGAGAEVATVLLGLQKNFESVPRGDEFTMRGTGTTTAVANAWTNCTVTWADALPQGNYVCTGFEAIGTTMKAARLIFENQWDRPGCIGTAVAGNRQFWRFYTPELGAYGRFRSTRMPNVEILCNAADTAQEFYLSFVRVGG